MFPSGHPILSRKEGAGGGGGERRLRERLFPLRKVSVPNVLTRTVGYLWVTMVSVIFLSPSEINVVVTVKCFLRLFCLFYL